MLLLLLALSKGCYPELSLPLWGFRIYFRCPEYSGHDRIGIYELIRIRNFYSIYEKNLKIKAKY